jgi:gliding motility-associated-like protein
VSATGVVTGIAIGTATATYSTALCGIRTAVVTVNPVPGAIAGTTNVCIGTTGTLTNPSTGGTWTSGNTTVATVGASTGTLYGVSAGVTYVTYILPGGCYAVAIVTVLSSPTAGTITGPSTVCAGDSVLYTSSVAGGIWSTTGTLAIVTAAGTVRGLSAGTATISYTVVYSCGTDIATKVVTVLPAPDAGTITGDSSLCVGDTTTLSNIMTGGTWSSTLLHSSLAAGGKLVALSPGSDTVRYIVSAGGCTGIATKVITIHALPDPGMISGFASLCSGASVTLAQTVAGGTWSTSNIAIATIDNATGLLKATGFGTVLIIYRTAPDANGCVNDTFFTVTVAPPSFTLTSTVKHISCFGANDGSIIVTVNGGPPPFTYLWSNGANTNAINFLPPGGYTIKVAQPATQCVRTDSFNIIEPDSLNVSSTVTDDTCFASVGSIVILSTGGTPPYKFAWSNSATTQSLPAVPAGTYTLALTDANNCIDTLQVTITEAPCSGIIIHDVITPNGDGVNDSWVIEGIQFYPQSLAQIFDKWGDLVYEKQGYNSNWYGQGKNGEFLPDCTYYYVVKLNAPNAAGGKDVFTGTVLVKR